MSVIKLSRLRIIAKLHLKLYESLIKLVAYVSAHSSANAFLIQCLSERSSQSPKSP